MQAQIRGAQLRLVRNVLVQQQRLFATPPTGTGLPPSAPSPRSGTAIPTVAVPSSTPGSSTINTPPPPPLPASSTLPRSPPPPPPPRPRRRLFRRVLIYTALGVLTFYPASGWLSTQYEGYREFFVANFPGAEFAADYADDHSWETFGYGTVSKKAVQGWQRVKGDEPKNTTSTTDQLAARIKEAEKNIQNAGRKAETETKKATRTVQQKASETADLAKSKASSVKDAVKEKVGGSGSTSTPVTLADRAVTATHDVADKAKALASEAKAKVVEATSDMPFNFSEGVEGIVREAERALGRGEAKVEDVVKATKDAVEATPGPRGFLDAQRPRELRPETVVPQKPSYEGKRLYSGPDLPLGHEPPPGYYIAPPPVQQAKDAVEKVKETLPLLGPKVKEFAASEPIISQLASTIDSLTSSLSTPTSSDANGILTKAHDDLSALSKRLDEVKRAEKEKLEQTVGKKTLEFEAILKNKERERASGEEGLRQGWEKERGRMVDEWRGALEKELDSQREGIEQRLREEVVSQGIELQRRWLRSIKTQVETERGGRLAKLDSLTTSLKQLERITLDNSATLDDNVRLHKVWSTLRAVQAKSEKGDVAFDDELRVLLSLSASDGAQESVIGATLRQLERSGVAQSGVKSFAQLSSWFTNSVSPRCHSASLVPAPQDAGVLFHLASATISKLMFSPKAGLVEGDDVSSVLARAVWCLGENDLDGAAREVNGLGGWPGKLAADWLRETRRRLEVMQALQVVDAEATLGSLLLV